MRKSYFICLLVITLSVTVFFSQGFCSELQHGYDDLNRLMWTESPGKYRIEYTYDAVGNRLSKVIVIEKSYETYDDDNDIDGLDLSYFSTRWDGTDQSLSDFANDFGKTEE